MVLYPMLYSWKITVHSPRQEGSILDDDANPLTTSTAALEAQSALYRNGVLYTFSHCSHPAKAGPCQIFIGIQWCTNDKNVKCYQK